MKLLCPQPNPVERYPSLRHIVIKLSKIKERILRAARAKKLIIYKETPKSLQIDISVETL